MSNSIKWVQNGFAQKAERYPHDDSKIDMVDWLSKKSFIATWTEDFDSEISSYWFIIKDEPFDINSIKAKYRYEIKKGLKSFCVRRIRPNDYKYELYSVYVESMQGYAKPHIISQNSFIAQCKVWNDCREVCSAWRFR